ncbi:MAG: peptidylprolyl isomerase [Geobacteraceae bacterium]|nr:peptidylprolyl isomerase [Geobacteraceae bacterium]
MMKHFPVILLLVVLTCPFPARAELVSSIAALVNDEPITTFDIDREKEGVEKGLDPSKPLDAAGKEQLRQAALESLIGKKLIQQKVKELDVKVSDEEVRQAIEDVKRTNNITQERLQEALAARGISYDEYKAQIREQLERLRLISLEVRSKIQISEKEARDYYAANPDAFQIDESFHVRQIFFKLDSQASEAERKRVAATAEKVLAEARGGADFATLARKYSQDSSAGEGGDLGFLKKGDILPEIEATLTGMKNGDISALIRTPVGIHIMKLEEHRQGKRQTFESAKPDIEDILYKKKSEERFNQWLADLRKNASIEIR